MKRNTTKILLCILLIAICGTLSSCAHWECWGWFTREVPEIAPTCTEAGRAAYYDCPFCPRFFSDEDCKHEVSEEDLVIPALGHDWIGADCQSPKICKRCGVTDGEALGHTPEEDDGNCMTEVKCSVCGVVTTPAKTEHIAHAEDGDCTTPITCTACDTVIATAKAHDYTGEWQSDAEGHWHVCQNDGCSITDTKMAHSPNQDEATATAPKKCTECDYIIEPQLSHDCTYTITKYDGTHHWKECACGAIDETTKSAHDDVDDHNCTTEDKCSCGYVVSEAKDHVAGADDGNCTTAIKCQNCDQDAVAGATGHNDTNGDFKCDNGDCQVNLPGAPKDENEGIDLPIDRN